MPRPMAPSALEITARGVVQGVGFRPFVHRLASRCGLSGWVENTPGGVVARVEGEPEAVARFRALFRAEAPPAARITRLSFRVVTPTGTTEFAIRESRREGIALSTIPPEIGRASCRERV